jgi:hypothetical protein
MVARVTLRLPDDLHRRLQSASQRSGASLNQSIVAAVGDALVQDEAGPVDSPLDEQARHVRRVLGELAVELEVSHLPARLRPSGALPATDSLRESMPALVPHLSATISADRDERG